MKKILFVLNDFKFGGITKVNSVIANELGKNHQVVLYNSGRGKCRFPVKVPIHQETYRFGGISYFFPRIMKKFLQWTGIPLNPFVFEKERFNKLYEYVVKHGMDVVVLNAYQIIYAQELKRRLPNLIILGWLHNNGEIYLEKHFKSFKKHFLDSVAALDHLVCLTPGDQKIFEPYASSAVCIYNPLTLKGGGQSDLAAKTISFVGRIDIAHKGIDYLCEIAARLPAGWQVKVAGPGRKKDKQIFEKLQQTFKTEGKLVYVGTLKGKALARHYQESSIFMMTSRWEGMPLVLAEAMSVGLPIIAFAQSGSEEVLQGGKWGVLVSQGDVAGFVAELAKLTEEESLRSKFSHASLERAKDFSLVDICREWEALF